MSALIFLKCISYSGITTKIRSMTGRLITKEQLQTLAALPNVPSAAEYLSHLPAYQGIFAGLDEASMHRSHIEQLLSLSLYEDYAKLYRFSNLKHRSFLNLHFMHYEIDLLKQCLRKAWGHGAFTLDLSLFQGFFDFHSKLDLAKLSVSANLTEFIQNLEGSPYHALLASINTETHTTLFDYEMVLDLYYFKTIWKEKSSYLSKSDQVIRNECFGSKLDLLNIQWIHRAKQYYHLNAGDIYALLIPVHYHLKKDTVTALVESVSMDEFWSILRLSHYGSLPAAHLENKMEVAALNEQVLHRIYTTTSRKNPYSIASLNSYLYFKEQEIQKIITTIECIRYGVYEKQGGFFP